jgi:hypothetical protein
MDSTAHSQVSAPPPAVAYVRDLLHSLAAPWLLSGGWAADAWLGRQTREHQDVDITVFQEDQRAVFEHLAGWALVAHDTTVPAESTQQWDGRRLDLPAHVHAPASNSALSTLPALTHAAYAFEFLLNGRTERTWVLNPEAGITVPIEMSTGRSPWGVPTAPPEIVMFFKAGAHVPAVRTPRDRDEQDFFALLPVLTDPARTWLSDSIALVRPDHPWLAHLQDQ